MESCCGEAILRASRAENSLLVPGLCGGSSLLQQPISSCLVRIARMQS